MPFTKESLKSIYNLSLADVEQTLLACQLPISQPEYSDWYITNYFEKIRAYINQGHGYEAAKNLLRKDIALQQVQYVQEAGEQIGEEFDQSPPEGHHQRLLELKEEISTNFRSLTLKALEGVGVFSQTPLE